MSKSSTILPASFIKIEAGESPVHSQHSLSEPNSDQDELGSNMWDFTDEEHPISEKDSESSTFNHLSEDEFDLANKLQEKIAREEKIQDKVQQFHERFDIPSQSMTIDRDKTEGYKEHGLNEVFNENLEWRKVNYDFPFPIPGVKEFDVKDGIQVEKLKDEINPMEFFNEFLNENFYDEVARMSNISIRMDGKRREIIEEITPKEIKTFFGILFLFGLMKKPNIPSYWSNDSLISTECLSRVMAYQRFQKIKKYITFYDKTKPRPNNGDSFYKVRMFQDHVLDNSKRVYIPERDLSIDESIILYTGLHRLKVYMPQKPNRYGFKAFVLAEASTGYICNFMMSEGRLKGSEELHSKKVVLDMLRGYEDKGYRVYMDRWYTSSELFMDMKRKGIGACGTILLNRVKMDKNLLKVVNEFRKNDSSLFYTNDTLMFTVFYHYKRQVHMISNIHDNSTIKVEKTKKLRGFDRKDFKVYSYESPVMIRDYQFKMKGVDLFNQRMSYYSVNFRSLRWYFRIVYFYMEMAMINSHLVYVKSMNANKRKPLSHADYRIEVLKKLMNWQGPKKIDLVNADFHRNQLKLTAETCKKNYKPGIMDIKKIGFGNAEISVECFLDKQENAGKCEACRPKNKAKKTQWVCKFCKKFCCRGPCFQRHKLHTLLSSITLANQGIEFLNLLLLTGKFHLFQESQQITKLQKTDLEECRLKKQAILEYTKSMNYKINEEMLSEKSKSIESGEEEEEEEEGGARRKTEEEARVTVNRKNKEIQIGGKRRGRPPGGQLGGYQRKKVHKEIYNEKEIFGNEDEELMEKNYKDEENENKKQKKIKSNEIVIRPRLINKKLFEFDQETNQLKVRKSKLAKTERLIELEHKNEVQNLEQKRKGRRLRNIGFLLSDFFKEIDVKGAIKNNYQLMNFSLMLDKEPEESKSWEFSQQQAKKAPKINKPPPSESIRRQEKQPSYEEIEKSLDQASSSPSPEKKPPSILEDLLFIEIDNHNHSPKNKANTPLDSEKEPCINITNSPNHYSESEDIEEEKKMDEFRDIHIDEHVERESNEKFDNESSDSLKKETDNPMQEIIEISEDLSEQSDQSHHKKSKNNNAALPKKVKKHKEAQKKNEDAKNEKKMKKYKFINSDEDSIIQEVKNKRPAALESSGSESSYPKNLKKSTNKLIKDDDDEDSMDNNLLNKNQSIFCEKTEKNKNTLHELINDVMEIEEDEEEEEQEQEQEEENYKSKKESEEKQFLEYIDIEYNVIKSSSEESFFD